MSKPRKICVVTGTRAEYGLLYWLMKEIQDDADLQLQLVVTGAHLSEQHGLTVQHIEADGFVINEKVEVVFSGDTPLDIAKNMGAATAGLAESFIRLQPDIVVLLGDRYEIMATAQAAFLSHIPIAHIHGGEITEGALDEAFRHSITKMSHFHFVAAEEYRNRVIQLGENPAHIFNYGAPGLDNIKRLALMKKNEIENTLDFHLGEINFLVTYHPTTLGDHSPQEAMTELLAALDEFKEAKIIITKPNADSGNHIISAMIDEYARNNHRRSYASASLGQLIYLSVMNVCDVVIGNSSSGLIEAPSLKKPTVNIGLRQRGRIRADSVIDCGEEHSAIISGIQRALSSDFKKTVLQTTSPFGDGETSLKIKDRLKTVPLENILRKHFHDLYLPRQNI